MIGCFFTCWSLKYDHVGLRHVWPTCVPAGFEIFSDQIEMDDGCYPFSSYGQKKGAMQLHMIGSALGTNQTKYVTVTHNMPGASSRVLWGSMTGRGDMCCCSALGDTVIFWGVPNKICRTPSDRSAVPQRHRGCYGAIGILFLWGFLVLPWSNWVYIDPGCRQHFSGWDCEKNCTDCRADLQQVRVPTKLRCIHGHGFLYIYIYI